MQPLGKNKKDCNEFEKRLLIEYKIKTNNYENYIYHHRTYFKYPLNY